MLTNSNEIVNDISRTKIEKSKNIIFTLKNSRKYKLLKRLVKLPILTFFQKNAFFLCDLIVSLLIQP